MFGKKLLSIVGLLFIGNQISSVSAGCTPTYVDGSVSGCDSCDGTDADGLYYVEGTGENTDHILISVSGSDSTASCSQINDAGYYRTLDGNYYKVIHSTFIASTVETVANAVACAPGKFELQNGKFCLDSTNVLTMGDDKKYLFKGSTDVFSAGETNVVLKSNENSITLDNTINGKEYCVTEELEIMGTKESYCADAECETYYYCTSGVCSEVEDVCEAYTPDPDGSKCDINDYDSSKCPDGYYLVDGDDGQLISSVATGTLIQCTEANEGNECVEVEDIGVGYYRNIGNGDGNIPFIFCGTDGICTGTAVEEVAADGNCSSSMNVNNEGISLEVGAIISNGPKYMFCLDTNAAGSVVIGYQVDEETSHFMSVDATNAFLEIKSNSFVQLDISKGNVLLKTYETNEIPERYQYTNSNNQIKDRAAGSDDTSMCSAGSVVAVNEFKNDACNDRTISKKRIAYYKVVV